MIIERLILPLIALIPNKNKRKALRHRCRTKILIRKIISEHKKISTYLMQNYVKKYFEHMLPTYNAVPKKKLQTDKVIWQFWAQGVDATTPRVVKTCLNSVKKYSNGYEVILLTLDTIHEYIDLPEELYNKLQSGKQLKMAHFSDVLRLYLLSAYGGIWIDATILLTAPIDEQLLSKNFFMYQRAEKPQNYKEWEKLDTTYFSWEPGFCVNLLNSFIIAKKHTTIISILRDIVTHYWIKEHSNTHYFVFQILFNILITLPPPLNKCENCDILSDLDPHLMHKHIFDMHTEALWNTITATSSIHKLTYYSNIPPNSLLSKILLEHEKPYMIKPVLHNNRITFCTMCFNLHSNNLDKIKRVHRPYYSFYLQSLKELCHNYNNIALWCDQETADFLQENNITHVRMQVLSLNELPLFEQKNMHLELLAEMKAQSFNEGYLLKDLSPEDIIDYVTLVHSKIEIIKWAKDNNFYNSEFFYWIDAGKNNPVYYRCWQNWDGIINMETKKFKGVLLTSHKKIHRSMIAIAEMQDIALIKAPYEITADIFVLHKDVIDRFYDAYKETYNFLLSKRLFTTEQSIFSAMLKRGYEDLFEFSKSHDYVDTMNLVAKKNNIENIVDDSVKLRYKRLLAFCVRILLTKKHFNTFKQRVLYK